MLEVELKFALADPIEFDRRLQEAGFQETAHLSQADHYFNHPLRDFAETDEAFRLRVVGDEAELTYKGPRLDRQTKTRREIELPLRSTENHIENARTLIEALGFRPVASVVKTRRQGVVLLRDRPITVARDSLDGIGEFVELELVVDEPAFATARDDLLDLARMLDLAHPIRQSYLELVLAARCETR